MDAAAANVKRLEQMQSFQKIYAPFDGIITARNIDIGALINAGSNGPGKEMFHMAATHMMRVYVEVPQVKSQVGKPGTPAELTLAETAGTALPRTGGADLRRDRSRRRGRCAPKWTWKIRTARCCPAPMSKCT